MVGNPSFMNPTKELIAENFIQSSSNVHFIFHIQQTKFSHHQSHTCDAAGGACFCSAPIFVKIK